MDQFLHGIPFQFFGLSGIWWGSPFIKLSVIFLRSVMRQVLLLLLIPNSLFSKMSAEFTGDEYESDEDFVWILTPA